MTATTEGVEIAPGEAVEEQYVVRLLFKFNANSPAHAVDLMIRELADHGLSGWHYRVENQETGELFFVHPSTGEVKNIDDIISDDEDDDDEGGDGDESGATEQ